MASGRATMPTITPAVASLANCRRSYPRSVVISFGRNTEAWFEMNESAKLWTSDRLPGSVSPLHLPADLRENDDQSRVQGPLLGVGCGLRHIPTQVSGR